MILLYLESIGNPRKFSRIARRVSRAKPIVAVRSGRTTQGVPMGHAVRQIAAPPEAVDAMFRQAGIIQVEQPGQDVRRRPAAGPPAAAERLPGRDRRQLGRARTARGGRRGVQRAHGHQRDRSRCGRDRGGLRGRARRGDRRRARRRGGRRLHPAHWTPAAPRSPTCSPRWGSSPTSPWSPPSSAGRGCPSCCGSPTSSGHTAGRGSVPSYPEVESAVRALAAVVEYAAWLQRGDESVGVLDGLDMDAAKRQVNELLIDHPDGRDLTGAELGTLLASYGIELWERVPVTTARGGGRGRRAARLGRRTQGDRGAAAPASRPGARVAQHRRRRGRCATRGTR